MGSLVLNNPNNLKEVLGGEYSQDFTEEFSPAYRADVVDAIRHLITLSRKNESTGKKADGITEHNVLVDVEADGMRYLLVRSRPKEPAVQDLLSPREQEIAQMIAKGYPNKTIAAVLDISCWTVCTHLRRIFAKLGVSSRAAMVAKLLNQNMIQQ